MASLANGSVKVTPDRLEVMGNTGNKDANTTVASLLADKLGEGADYSIDITYQKSSTRSRACRHPKNAKPKFAKS